MIGGGGGNIASQTAATICGGEANSATGTMTFIGGGASNIASNTGATVGGGGRNRARGMYSFVGGGGGGGLSDSNSAAGDQDVVAGGWSNATLGGGRNTIGGGAFNRCGGASIADATVGGGSFNYATGSGSTVPGGNDNVATGTNSLAAGHQAQANHDVSFVWNDNCGTALASTGTNQFRVGASGGTVIYSNCAHTSGVQLAAGGSAWAVVSDSTKKENFRAVNTKRVLDKIAQLNIREWNYKSQDDSIRHMGPMAQDFYAAFGLGESDTTISTLDPDGVLFAAVQELARQSDERKLANDELKKQNDRLSSEVAELRSMLQSLMADKQQSQKSTETR